MNHLCAIVPSFNHCETIGGVIGELRRAGLPVIVVDDGSDEPARTALASLPSSDGGVTVHRLDTNQGKGGAVMAGLRAASAAGFTHALQVDADGQHDLSALNLLIAAQLRHPQATVCGNPVYDASAPMGRRIGRRITRFWVAVETLSLRMPDTMCGFRIYPLAPMMALLSRVRLGTRMDFDIEVLVRLAWSGIPIATVPVMVRYPDGNSSNFKMLYDNCRISWMHTRLVVQLPLKLPGLLLRGVTVLEYTGRGSNDD